jgi:energy-coupling factor transport system permease protein
MLEKKMSIFFYSNKKTLFHLLDPRVKILFLILLFIIAFIINNVYQMIILFFLLILFFIISDSISSLKKVLYLFLFIGLMIFVLWFIFFKSDEKIYFYKNLFYYKGVFNYAGLYTLRFLNMLLAGLLFLSMTSYEDFSYGLLLFGLPYPVAFTVLLSFKLVDSFINSAFTIAEAQKARGNDVTRGNIIKRIVSYTPLVIPLILNGIKKAQNLIIALETRGFSPQNKINIKGKYKITTVDIVFLILSFLGFIFICIYL